MGKLISFIGMDGSGKSTLASEVLLALKKKGNSVKVIYGGRGRGNVLPIQAIGKLFRKAGGQPSNKPGKKFEQMSIAHTLSAPVFTLDLLLRYLFLVFPAKVRYDYVITDRYSIDILLMNKVPSWLKSFLFLFIPSPDYVFYIYHSVSVLHKRKPDHYIADLKRQEKIFAKIVKKVHAVKVKNVSIKKSVKEIMRKLHES